MLLTSLPRGPALGSPTARSSPLEAGGHDQVRGDTKGVKIHANIKLARVVLYVGLEQPILLSRPSSSPLARARAKLTGKCHKLRKFYFVLNTPRNRHEVRGCSLASLTDTRANISIA